MNWKIRSAAMSLCLTIFIGGGVAAAQEHAHTWNAWTATENGSQHMAACLECGEIQEKKCLNYTATLDGSKKVSVCANCGTCKYGAFERNEGATATPVAEKPLEQRGSFVVYGKALPFKELDADVLYAFTIGYELDGAAVTFKNKSTVQMKIDAELPEGFRLIRITPASGDDSTQTDEKWVDVEYTFEDGVLSFESKNPALHVVMAAE